MKIFCMLLASISLTPAVATSANDSHSDALRVYVGTYTHEGSRGIYLLRLNRDNGELSAPELVGEVEHPSFLVIHPDRPLLFAVNEVSEFQGQQGGGVSAFSIDEASGHLTLQNQQPSQGGAPCYIVVDKAGKHVLVANYSGGSVAVLPFDKRGHLQPSSSFVQHAGASVNPKRQEAPHAHSINVDASGRFAIAADLGLDKLLVYRYDSESGTLSPNEPPFAKVAPGAGPRHLAFHPNGEFAYVINEMDCTITAFRYNSQQGTLTEVQTVPTLPHGVSDAGFSTAEVQVHPSGKFVYGSNRGHDSIAIFSVDQKTGELTPRGHQSTLGKTPRNFGIDPTGKFLLAANQSSGNIVVFRIDAAEGSLDPTGHEAKVPMPVCVKFLSPKSR